MTMGDVTFRTQLVFLESDLDGLKLPKVAPTFKMDDERQYKIRAVIDALNLM